MNRELSRLNKLLKREDEIYHQFAKRLNLTDAQFWVLYALCEGENELSQNSFCESWFYSKQTVNTAVTGLEKMGILYLEYSEGSHKQKNIYFTEKGKEFCDLHIKKLLDAEERTLTAISDKERDEFFSTLEKLLINLEKELS